MARKIHMKTGTGWAEVESYTIVPKRTIGKGGVVIDLEAWLNDPRNFPGPRATGWQDQTVLRAVHRQLGYLTGGTQAAEGTVSLNTIHKETGYDRKTVKKALARLQARNIIQYRTERGSETTYIVAWNLDFGEWRTEPPAA